MRSLLAFLVVCGCGGAHGAQPAQPAAPRPGAASVTTAPSPPGPGTSISGQTVCGRIVDLKQAHCATFEGLDDKVCVASFDKEVATPTSKDLTLAVGRCIVENTACDQVTNCMMAALASGSSGDPAPPDPSDEGGQLRACNDTSAATLGQAVGVPKAEWDRRKGVGLTKYSEAMSSKAQPIEMCGIHAENQWLGTLSCNDGSHPIANPGQAEDFRGGSLGPGGRCGSIIDVYNVKCPESTYNVYIDAYVCASPK